MGYLNIFLELGDRNLTTKNRKIQMPRGDGGVLRLVDTLYNKCRVELRVCASTIVQYPIYYSMCIEISRRSSSILCMPK